MEEVKKNGTERPYDILSHKSQVHFLVKDPKTNHEFLMLELRTQLVHQNTEYDDISDQKKR